MTFGRDNILRALALVGEQLCADSMVEITIVGGAAGLLTGHLSPAVVTGDVDAILFKPPGEIEAVLEAAGVVGRALSLPPFWLNNDAGLFRSSLPAGWEDRRLPIGTFGRLQVYAISRIDLMVTKFVAHRPADREHIQDMKPTVDELAAVRQHLDDLGRGTLSADDDKGRLDMARAYVEIWECRVCQT